MFICIRAGNGFSGKWIKIDDAKKVYPSNYSFDNINLFEVDILSFEDKINEILETNQQAFIT